MKISQLRGCDVSHVIFGIHVEISGVSAIGLFGEYENRPN